MDYENQAYTISCRTIKSLMNMSLKSYHVPAQVGSYDLYTPAVQGVLYSRTGQSLRNAHQSTGRVSRKTGKLRETAEHRCPPSQVRRHRNLRAGMYSPPRVRHERNVPKRTTFGMEPREALTGRPQTDSLHKSYHRSA